MKIIRTREVHDIDLSNNLANCEFTHTLTIYNIHTYMYSSIWV